MNNTNEYRKFLIERIGYFRTKANLSARELSNRIGMSNAYISKFEMGIINMPSEVLLDVLKVLNVTPELFFSKNPQTYEKDMAILEKLDKISAEGRDLILRLLERMN